ncbi:hypothetical protein GCM10023310_69370 [Paenibacillus vulneris]
MNDLIKYLLLKPLQVVVEFILGAILILVVFLEWLSWQNGGSFIENVFNAIWK